MQILGSNNLFQEIKFTPKISKARGTRALLVEDFCKELNKEIGNKYKSGEKWITIKEVKAGYIAFRLSHLKVEDLYYFLSNCRQAKCGFRKAFYGGLKVVDNHYCTNKNDSI